MRYQFIESTVVGGCIVIALELLLHPETASVRRRTERFAHELRTWEKSERISPPPKTGSPPHAGIRIGSGERWRCIMRRLSQHVVLRLAWQSGHDRKAGAENALSCMV